MRIFLINDLKTETSNLNYKILSKILLLIIVVIYVNICIIYVYMLMYVAIYVTESISSNILFEHPIRI